MSTPYMYNKKCEEVELLERAARVDLETLAQFMILHSFATGHGDSISGLLLEFHPQLHALRSTIASQAKLLEEAREALKGTFIDLVALRPIIAALIQSQHNVETWNLHEMLNAMDASAAQARDVLFLEGEL